MLDGVRVCFASEMLCGFDKIVCLQVVRCIKFCVNIADFAHEFLEAFCFSSANLKPNKPLCGAVQCGPDPDIFLIYAQLIELQKFYFFIFFRDFLYFVTAFFTQFMTETWLTLSILSIRRKPFPSKYSCIAFCLICAGQPRWLTVQWHLHFCTNIAVFYC